MLVFSIAPVLKLATVVLPESCRPDGNPMACCSQNTRKELYIEGEAVRSVSYVSEVLS